MTILNTDNKEVLTETEPATGKVFTRNDILICSTQGYIFAIHKCDGSRIWKSKFPSGAMGGVVSLFITEGDKLIVGANGKTSCMSLMNGETVWINKMQGFGNEEVSILTTPKKYLKSQNNAELEIDGFMDISFQDYDEVIEEKQVVISCSRGKVMAIDIENGNTIWTYTCPGGWYNIPVAITEPASIDNGKPDLVAYIGAGQWIYCLKVKTGEVVWSSRVSDSKVGLNYMTLATPWSSRLAAEAYSSFSQNPVAQIRSMVRHQEKSL